MQQVTFATLKLVTALHLSHVELCEEVSQLEELVLTLVGEKLTPELRARFLSSRKKRLQQLEQTRRLLQSE